MRWHPMVGLGLTAALASVLVASCALVGGIDGDYVGRPSAAQCLEMCPGATDCLGADCSSEDCTPFNQPTDTLCDDEEPADRYCDGQGSCVECNQSSQCENEMACDQHFCVPLHCINDDIDPGETDEDCGGPDCAPCDNGRNCGTGRDCASGFCDDGECAPCETREDCEGDFFCDADGVCKPPKPIGQDCEDDSECASGHCPLQDFLCCESACNGICESCRAVNTDGANGKCEAVSASNDPDNECTPGVGSCTTDFCSGAAAQCEMVGGATVCRPAIGACDAEETCSGNSPTCPADSVAAQYTTCNTTGECNNVGECKTPRGGFCGVSNECATNICIDSVCCLTPCTDLCQSCVGGAPAGTCVVQPDGTESGNECFGGCCSGGACGTGNCAIGEPCPEGSGDCTSFSCPAGFCD